MPSRRQLDAHTIITNYKNKIKPARREIKRVKRDHLLTVIAQFDLPGSTKKIIRNQKEGISKMLLHNKLCTEIIENNGGQVIKELGDAVLVLFESVPSACISALNVIYNFKKYERTIHTKVTITAGGIELIKTRCELDVYGKPVNLCNRLSRHADPDSVIIEDSRYLEVVHWLSKDRAVISRKLKKDCCEFGKCDIRKITLKPRLR